MRPQPTSQRAQWHVGMPSADPSLMVTCACSSFG